MIVAKNCLVSFPNLVQQFTLTIAVHRHFSFSEKESELNDNLLHFVELLNVHNCDKVEALMPLDQTQHIKMYKNDA